MNSLFAQAWQRLNAETIGSERYWWIALQNVAGYDDMEPLIAKYVHGRTLDVGAGQMAWRSLLEQHGAACVSGDLAREHAELDLLFDVTRPLPFAAETFDMLFCCSVLEHTREPWQAFSEMWRVLVPGGRAIMSVPFIHYLHGQPHDYYRFTRYGVAYLARHAGFEVVEIITNGGLFHFLFNAPSIILSTLWATLKLYRLIRPTTYFWLALARMFDSWFDQDGLFAMNHILVLRKRDAGDA
jgi:SAM-dependent methyltransferase